MPNILRDYQDSGNQQINEVFSTDDVLMYINGTGLGKTVTFVNQIKQYLIAGKRVLLIAHRIELIDQAFATLYNEKIFSGIIMADRKIDYSLPCQIGSIQTLIRRKQLPPADLVIIDEAHKIDQEKGSYMKVLNDFYPNAKILMVTATPIRTDGKGFQDVIKGKKTQIIYNYNLKEGIDNGWLVPLDYFVSSVPDLSSIKMRGNDYEEESAKKTMELAPIVDSYLEHAAGKSGVFFSVNVAHSEEVTAMYNQRGIPAAHIDGTTDAVTRKKIIQDFDAGFIKMMTNCAIFIEGTDFKICQFIQDGSPTKSLARWFQKLGRGTRPERGLVDRFLDAELRKQAIAKSSKSSLIVLDNAGAWLEHSDVFYNDFYVNWQPHFEGTYKKPKPKPTEEMEMLVFIAEDEAGNIRRTKNPKELEGLKLIRVTKEHKQKAVQLKSLKEFEKLFAMYDNIKAIKRPGYKAIEAYIKFCSKGQYLMVPEIWNFIEEHAINRFDRWIIEAKHQIQLKPNVADVYRNYIKSYERQRVSKIWLKGKQTEYAKNNADQLANYMVSFMDLTI